VIAGVRLPAGKRLAPGRKFLRSSPAALWATEEFEGAAAASLPRATRWSFWWD
jgi:hypothetical protein